MSARKLPEDACSHLDTAAKRKRCRYKRDKRCIYCGKPVSPKQPKTPDGKLEYFSMCDVHMAYNRNTQKKLRAKMDENPI